MTVRSTKVRLDYSFLLIIMYLMYSLCYWCWPRQVPQSHLTTAQSAGATSQSRSHRDATNEPPKTTLVVPIVPRSLLMEPLDAGSETQASTLAKPCIACRKRKVKCSKTRPCANCARAKQLCLYDGDEPEPDIARQSIEGSFSADGEVRERLARLEKLMEMMMVRESGRSSAGSDAGFGAAVARDALSHITHSASTSPSQARSPHSNVTRPSETAGAPVGQILFQEVHSAYFDAGFWAGLVTEVSPIPNSVLPVTE
jgi:hypothetical protein